MNTKSLSLLLLLFMVSLISKPQEIGLPVIRNYTPKEYSGSAQVWSAVQDNRGVMYFGGGNSVLVYDGVSWRNIPVDNNATVYDLAIDKNDRTYVATVDNFGYLKTNQVGSTHYKSLTSLMIDSTYKIGVVWSVKPTTDFVYFRTSEAILQYCPAENKITLFEAGENGRFTGDFVHQDIYYTQLSNKGLMKIEHNELKQTYQSEFFNNKNAFRLALPFNASKFLMPTRTDGLFIYDAENNITPTKYNISDKSFLKENYIYGAYGLQNKYFIIGSLGKGAVLSDKYGQVWQYYNDSTLLQANSIHAISTDANKNIWMGLNNGISKTEHSIDLSFWDKNAGLNGIVLNVIRFNDTIYIATSTKIYFIDGNNQIKEVKNIPVGQNWCFLETNNNASLLAGTQHGIFEIIGDTAIQIYKGGHAFAIVHSALHPSRIYSTDYPDLISFRFENGNWVFEGKWEGIKEQISGIAEDEDGYLWLGTYRNGAFRVTPNYENITKPVKIRHYTENDGFLPFKLGDKIIWGTENGLFIYNSQEENFEPFCELGDAFCKENGRVFYLQETGDDKIWLCRSSAQTIDIGYLRTTANKDYEWVYEPFRRIPQMAIETFYIDSKGIGWFGGSEGIFRYDMNKDIKDYKQSFDCLIRKVTIGTDSLLYGGNHLKTNNTGYNNQVELKYKYNSLKFEFAAPFFDQEEKTLYSYKLIGYDKEWSIWSRQTEKEYTNLPVGKYSFSVKARNIYDTESEIAYYQFKVLPPWYRTIWAYLLYITVAISLVWLIVIYNTRRLKAKNIVLERIVKKRTAELTEKNKELTQQKKEILIQKNELRSVIESQKEAICRFKPDTTITYANKAFCKYYEKSAYELIGKEWLTFFPADKHDNIKIRLQKLMKEPDKTISYVHKFVMPNGNIKWMESTDYVVKDRNGNFMEFQSTGSDITDKRKTEKLESELLATKKIIEFKKNFMANMSHEIRTPLTGILGMAEILFNTNLSEKQKEYLISLKQSGENLNEIVNLILDYSNIDTGKAKLNNELFSLEEVFIQNQKLFQTIKTKKSINFSYNVNSKIPQFIIADRQKVNQIIRNLINNAVKFTQEGKITLKAVLEKTPLAIKASKPKNRFKIKIHVIDTGIGISPEKQKQLFIPFSQIEQKDVREIDSTGLGLAISKKLTDILGGDIGVKGNAEKGSDFWFTFKAEKGKAPAKKEKSLNEVKPLKILLVEDKKITQTIVKLMLESRKHKVQVADNGKQAIDVYKPGDFNIILMDIQMPVMDGITATKILKQKYKDSLPPVIGFSANAFEGDRERYIEQGMDDYLNKPLNENEFDRVVKSLIK